METKIVFYGKLPEWLLRKRHRKDKETEELLEEELKQVNDLFSYLLCGSPEITTLYIPEGITAVRAGLFDPIGTLPGDSIDTVVLPSTLITISHSSIPRYTKTIVSYASNPPTLLDSLSSVETIYVLSETEIRKYRTAWHMPVSKFKLIEDYKK